MATRSIAVTAAVAAGAALVATGITYASAASEPAQAAAFAAPQGNSGNNNNNNNNDNNNDNSKGREGGGGGHEEHEHHHKGEGRIFVNEREYSPHESSCITVVSGLGANSLNVRNDSKKFVEVFNGATCDNGAPIATVGPHSSSNGLFPRHVRGGVKVKHGVVGSIRIVHRFDEGHGDNGDNDDNDDNDYEYHYSYSNGNGNNGGK
ncbi:hypothetical protein [Streptomyces sp. NPDC052036]|uniref:hypothetical protein n=1 Tax=unclassified Streptomyces TaxID=2593676 RepID=UPI00342DA352